MKSDDTIKLLKECDAGSKMAVSSLDDALSYTKDEKMLSLLTETKKHHEKLGNDLHEMLNELEADEKEPSMMAKGMSKIKMSAKIGMNNCDGTVADLIVEGCDMGIRSLQKYMNQYPVADKNAKDLCKRLINIEDELRRDLYSYL